MPTFKLHSEYKPAGDQPNAIEKLTEGVKKGLDHQTLLGVTGSGKTFTMANVLTNIGKPTLVIAHNKTLAAQLAQEYKEFFPDSAVHYFVSYYDYYQPEAYVPTSDTYIEKEAQINEEIERLRHATTQALLTRRDVIVVASVSCIYGLGSPEEYEKVNLKIQKGDSLSRYDLIRELVDIYFERTNADLSPGEFRALGNTVEVMPVNEKVIIRVDISGGVVQSIKRIDPISREIIDERDSVFIFPAKHFVTDKDKMEKALKTISAELEEQLEKLNSQGKILEAERLKRRTNYDLALLREVGYVTGVENYSRHFSGKEEGEPPDTLLSYFPRKEDGTADFLTIIDESHVTIPQIGGMFAGDRSRKETLIEHGFRLPSAKDNRPLQFEEFEERIGQVIYTSATPGPYELKNSRAMACPAHSYLLQKDKTVPGFAEDEAAAHRAECNCAVVEQIIRPTGLIDPQIAVRGILENADGGYKGQVFDFIDEAEKVIEKGERAIATTLTKKMAEDLAEFLRDRGMKAEYLHSEIKTIERIGILTDFRKGKFDVLVGVNLLREGLDLPEVSFIGILDADKEGFLRSETSLIQIIGRAARNVAGKVILYADNVTGSMERAMNETERRRKIQIAHNKKHGITPKTIIKRIKDITEELRREHDKVVERELEMDEVSSKGKKEIRSLIKNKQNQMAEAVKDLAFETAAILRDEIVALEEILESK